MAKILRKKTTQKYTMSYSFNVDRESNTVANIFLVVKVQSFGEVKI